MRCSCLRLTESDRQDGNEIVLSLPDAYTKQLGDELQQAGIRWKTTYASDDDTTRAVYESLPSTYMHILRPVVDIQPLRPEHILEDTSEVDWEGITGWMEEFFAVEEIRRQEDGQAKCVCSVTVHRCSRQQASTDSSIFLCIARMKKRMMNS